MTLPKVHELRLDNGFRALLVRRTSLPVVASVLWYQVGSRDERTGETGVSHFLEHMMFKGTDRYAKGEIDQQTAKMGGSNNAWTDNDSTAYYFSLAADRWEAALEIEASRMRRCALDPLEFASEKEVVLQELRMGEDDPWRPLFQSAESMMYQVHPYHHPIIGYAQDLERLQVADMRAYYDRSYGPNRAFLTVVGDIDVEQAGKRITELFGDIPSTAEPRREALTEPRQNGERRAVVTTNYQVARLCIGFPTCRMGERDDYALDLLAHALGNSKNSLLYRRLVLEEELVTYVGVYNETRLDPGVFMVLAELRSGADRAKVERIVREEIDKMTLQGVPKRELQRIRAQIAASFLFQDETVLDLAQKIARFEAMAPGGYRTLETVLPTYESLSNAELKDVALRYFAPDRGTVVWALPAEAHKAVRKPSSRQAKKKATGRGVTAKKPSAKKKSAKQGAAAAKSAKKPKPKQQSAAKKPAKKSKSVNKARKSR